MPALIGHGIHNGSTLAVGALAVEIPGFTADPGAAVAFQPLWLDALGLALAVGGFAWFAEAARRRQVRGLDEAEA